MSRARSGAGAGARWARWLRRQRARLDGPGAPPWLKPALGVAAILAGAALIVLGALLSPILTCRGSGCPSVAAIADYRPPQASRVFAHDGSVVADLSPQRRTVVELAEISPVIRDGVVAVEDRRFWRHGGVDGRSIARAALRNLRSLSLAEGFSTLEMQLARSIFPEVLPLTDRLRRKAWEMVLAARMGEELDKSEVLALYLNQIYMGSGLYGMEAAAQGYFGRSAAELTTAEAALLVGIIKTPERYHPRRHPARAVARRNLVLDLMVREGVLPRDEAERARNSPLRLAPPFESSGPAPYFVVAVRRELRERFGADAEVRGLRVFTGLDPDIQRAAQSALLEQIRRVEAGALGTYRHPVPDGTLAPADGNGSPYLQGMVVVLDPHGGEVRALVGGRDFTHSQYDRALQAHRQPGSAFKPVVYAAAVSRGMTATARISTSAIAVDDAGAPPWRPADHVADADGGLSAREALARSSNTAAVRVGRWVGERGVAETGRALGLTTPIPLYPSIHLGAAEVVPVELVAAYAAIGNGGIRVEPTLITRVEDRSGSVLWRAPAPRARALDEGAAYITLSMMQDVVDRGTGSAVRRAGFWLPAAGKTGTTNEAKDAWFIGMTPDLVAGVWLGFDRPRRIAGSAGGGALAAPVWAALMMEVYRERPSPAPWTAPPSLAAVAIDDASGLLATRNCPAENILIEYFMAGTEPLGYCPIHADEAGNLLERLWDRLRRAF